MGIFPCYGRLPQKPAPKALNDNPPVALASIHFKCIETRKKFAYRANRSTEDGILTLLHAMYKHPEKLRSYVCLLFLDFTSEFNTIQPHLMSTKLLNMDVNSRIIEWIYSFLTNRPQ